MERDGQFAGAQIRAEMPADLADYVDYQLARLLRDLLKLLVGSVLEIRGRIDRVE